MNGPRGPLCKGDCGYMPAPHIPADSVFAYVTMGAVGLFWLALFVFILVDCWERRK